MKRNKWEPMDQHGEDQVSHQQPSGVTVREYLQLCFEAFSNRETQHWQNVSFLQWLMLGFTDAERLFGVWLEGYNTLL